MTAADLVTYVESVLLPKLDADRGRDILARSREVEDGTEATARAFRAARVANREAEVVAASERLRQATWDVVWDCTHSEAWMMSWAFARAGIAIMTVDLVGSNGYYIEDYIDLIGPLTEGFPDFPLPITEES